MADRLDQVRLADAGGTQDEDVAPFADEATSSVKTILFMIISPFFPARVRERPQGIGIFVLITVHISNGAEGCISEMIVHLRRAVDSAT